MPAIAVASAPLGTERCWAGIALAVAEPAAGLLVVEVEVLLFAAKVVAVAVKSAFAVGNGCLPADVSVARSLPPIAAELLPAAASAIPVAFVFPATVFAVVAVVVAGFLVVGALLLALWMALLMSSCSRFRHQD